MIRIYVSSGFCLRQSLSSRSGVLNAHTVTVTCQLAGDWGAELAVQEGGGIRVYEEGHEDAEEEVESGDRHHDCQGVHPLTAL